MKRVLFFLESLAGGGAEKTLAEIVSRLNPEAYQITVCTVTDGDIYQDKVSRHCRYRSFLKKSDYTAGGLKKLFFWLKVKLIYSLPPRMVYKWFIRETYDIEAAFIEGFATKLIAASSNSESRKVAWVHTDMLRNAYADSCYANHERHCLAYKEYDRILCVSDSVKRAFEEKFFSSPKISVQYNPVNEEEILKLSNCQTDIVSYPRQGILLGTVGRLEKPKGYWRLIKCAKALVDKGYLFTIWLIGQGSEKAAIEQYVIENGMEQAVRFLGFRKNPYQYMRHFDAFICSSYAEGFSTAATESLILGVPVFSVDCAGMRELIGDSGCGEIVPNTDEALYHLLENLVSGEMVLERYSEAAKQRGRDFEGKTRIAEIERIFSDL